MLNSSHIQRKLQQGRPLLALLQAGIGPRAMVIEVYLTILSRYPTDEEVRAAMAYSTTGPAPRRIALLDLAWALINSDEFLYRH
jgi:hypothetical protein